MADNTTDRDVVLLHELSDQFGGASLGSGEGAISVFTHFDADGVFVAGAFIVGVLALFVGGKALIDFSGIDAEVPGEVAEGIVLGLEPTALENLGVGASTCTCTITLRRVDGDVAGRHRPYFVAAILPGSNHQRDIDPRRSGMIVFTQEASSSARTRWAAGGEKEGDSEKEEFFHVVIQYSGPVRGFFRVLFLR